MFETKVSWPVLKGEPLGLGEKSCPEILERNYHYVPRNKVAQFPLTTTRSVAKLKETENDNELSICVRVVLQQAILRLRHKYVKTCSCLLLTVLVSRGDHLTTQLRNYVKTHSASSALHVLSGLVYKFVNKNAFTKCLATQEQILCNNNSLISSFFNSCADGLQNTTFFFFCSYTHARCPLKYVSRDSNAVELTGSYQLASSAYSCSRSFSLCSRTVN